LQHHDVLVSDERDQGRPRRAPGGARASGNPVALVLPDWSSKPETAWRSMTSDTNGAVPACQRSP
jgi:hypothetical protein